MSNNPQREKAESDLAAEYARTGRYSEIGHSKTWFSDVKKALTAGNGTEDPREQRRQAIEARSGRFEMLATMRAGFRAGSVSPDDYENYLSGRAFDTKITAVERNNAKSELGRLSAQRKRAEDRTQDKEERAQKKEDSLSPADRLERARRETLRSVDDDWASDPEKRRRYNGTAHHQARRDALKAAGVDTEADTPHAPSVTGATGWGVARLAGAVAVSARSGAQFGGVVGNIATGLNQAVAGAGRLFTGVGEAIVGQIFAPLGKAGQFGTRLVGGIANTLVSAITGAGGIAAAGLKMGGALAGGIIGGLGAALGAGIGAAVGTFLLPGIGTLGGAVAGAGIVAAVGGAITSVVSQIGGAVGQALGAIGQAMGSVGKSITDTLGNIQGVLSDLIDTGKEFSAAAFVVQRGSGQSLGQSAGVVSLAKMLTGSPDGLNGIFSGFGSLYMPQKAQAFGINVGRNADPLSIIQKAQGTWNRFGGGTEGSIRRTEMLNVLFGGNEQIGGLLASGMAGKAVSIARSTAPSAKEIMQDYRLGIDLQGVGRQLDSIKMKFLNDLMPVIKLGVGTFGSFLKNNMGNIVSGLKSAGEFLFVKGPTMFLGFIDGVLGVAKAFTAAIPAMAQFTEGMWRGLSAMFNGVKSLIGGLMVGAAPLIGLLTHDARTAGALAKGGTQLLNMPGMDPEALSGGIGKDGKYHYSMLERAAMAAPGQMSAINNAQVGIHKYFGDPRDSESDRTKREGERQKMWDRGLGGNGNTVRVEHTVKLEVQDNPNALYKLKGDVTNHVATQFIRAESRAGGG